MLFCSDLSFLYISIVRDFLSLQVVLHGVVNMQLPNQWLWDMVDEFVYQFQSFCQYRAKMKNKTEQEIALLRQHDQVRHWVMFQRCSWIHQNYFKHK